MNWMVWKEAVITDLVRCKSTGVAFEEAWRMVMVAHPPRTMELGPRRPQLDDEVSVIDFLHDACADAWAGRREELRDLPAALDGGLARNWPTVGRGLLGG